MHSSTPLRASETNTSILCSSLFGCQPKLHTRGVRLCRRHSADGLVAGVRLPVKAGVVVHLELELPVVEPGVALHDVLGGIVEPHHQAIGIANLEDVVEELGAVGLLDLDRLLSAGEGVLREYVVLGTPGRNNVRLV
ncbi:unnamed protein product [Ectocarpus sp. 8 AP-2014]